MSLSSEPSTALHSKYFPLSPSLEHGANIVCTIGMHSTKESVVKKMIANGMNVARINMTHAKHADVIKIVDFIREEAARQGKEQLMRPFIHMILHKLAFLASSRMLKRGSLFILKVVMLVS